ncbi:hypothetical protein [Methanococcoides alaskense]|uniref:Uncharacterized protein n=1 Tax=Methanococcoides alaskense TaxID=325778 RepID=A0AA90U0F0_9EURY|nr:hypothetical protein [Methanococcoides alaskense]MDA0524798.1 hypothetical protein [Methanococcoides alaskense]MDR6223079.1 hypothetical protein [Methanococcoides alaskense]
MVLLLIAATLFTIVGAIMVLSDYNYYNGLQLLATALVFFTTAYLIKAGKLDIGSTTSNEKNPFIAGFMITVIALGLKGLFWAVGIAVFIISIYNIYKK